jgi:K+-sensing histidine kinase KdpD
MDPLHVAFASGFLTGALAILGTLALADVVFDKCSAENKRSSRLVRGLTGSSLLAIAWFSYIFSLDKSSVMLLMLVVILFCARLSGFMDVLFLSVLSATLLAYYVLPPTRSFEIANPKDKLSVVFSS